MVNHEPRRGADVPPPPRPVAPTVWSLPEGTQLFTVHPLEVDSVPVVPGSFPPGRAQRASRFAPLGSGVGVLYAATSALGVLTETVLHDLAENGLLVPEQYERFAVSSGQTTRSLRLAALHGGWLTEIGLQPEWLTHTDARHDAATVEWADAVHSDTDVAGLMWNSRRDPSAQTVALFADRAEGALRVEGNTAALGSPGGFEWLAGLCQGIGVRALPAV